MWQQLRNREDRLRVRQAAVNSGLPQSETASVASTTSVYPTYQSYNSTSTFNTLIFPPVADQSQVLSLYKSQSRGQDLGAFRSGKPDFFQFLSFRLRSFLLLAASLLSLAVNMNVTLEHSSRSLVIPIPGTLAELALGLAVTTLLTENKNPWFPLYSPEGTFIAARAVLDVST